MNRTLSLVLLVVGIALVSGAAYGVLHEPSPRVFTCERTTTTPSAVICEPGSMTGTIASVRRESGKSPRECFVLGTGNLCGGDATAAAAKVNALSGGEKTTVDLTPPSAPLGAVAFAGTFGLVIVLVALAKLGSIRKSSNW